MTERVALLAAGGTGGHLFPAQALAAELNARGWAVELATDERCDQYDFPARKIHVLPSDTFRSHNLLSRLRTFLTLGHGFLKARALLRKLKPNVVVGFGGYPTLPPLFAAAHLKIPNLIHEANVVLGRANKLLAKRATAIGLSAENTALLDDEFRAKARVVGMPVRQTVLIAAQTPYQAPGADDTIRVLAFGGSQGARVFADVVPDALIRLPEKLRARISLVQQVREEDITRTAPAITKLGLHDFKIASFFKDLPQQMADAHLILARSGAGTVNEITVIGRPSILVPLPHALDNDQLRNAQSLAVAGAAILAEQKELNPERLSALLSATLQDPLWMENCARAAKAFGRPNAAKLLADLVEDTARGANDDKKETA
jgi:UDP-N-acetylglucosamine--N-acetylmuramyl-(pentapeptide) pyrophosphoryl-undecaprenol N-acetylglucosamine transferase